MQEVRDKIDLDAIRDQFPVLDQQVNGKPLVYFDNAASSQTPQAVIDALDHFYQFDHANIHRGVHTLAERSTLAYEDTRKRTQVFINSAEAEEIIFTKGTTESINLVANSWGLTNLSKGDELLISQLEHHSNIVPWQLVAEKTGAIIKVIPILENGDIDLDEYSKLISERTKLLAVNYISNSLGTINPIKEIITLAHENEIVTMIDAAQAAPHHLIDVQDLDCDFLAFSSHKMFGPTGVGILYGKRHLLEEMPPYQGGGEMIKEVSFEGTTYNDIPHKFEAGTPNIADVIGFNEAIGFIEKIGYDTIQNQENELLERATELLNQIPGLKIYGTSENKTSVISFTVDGIHPYDIGQLLDAKGIAVRTGHHCTQPLMDSFEIEGTVRASFSVYNTLEEVEYFYSSLSQIVNKLT